MGLPLTTHGIPLSGMGDQRMVLETRYRGICVHRMLPCVYHGNLQTTYAEGGITKVGYTFVTIWSPKFRKTNFRPNYIYFSAETYIFRPNYCSAENINVKSNGPITGPSICVKKFGRPDNFFPSTFFRPNILSAERLFGRIIFRPKNSSAESVFI
jgi:hypothetical protein